MSFWVYGQSHGAEPLKDNSKAPISAAEQIRADLKDDPFMAVFEEMRLQNARLESISARILKANLALCQQTKFSIGANFHVLDDYQGFMQDMAKLIIDARPELTVRTIRDDSPAANAGLKEGDQLMAVGGQSVPNGGAGHDLYNKYMKTLKDGAPVAFKIKRHKGTDFERIDTLTIATEKICDHPVHLVYSKQANGRTDGRKVVITTELMKTHTDLSVALVVAHELSHIFAGHKGLVPSQALELEADRMALSLLQTAGYDIDEVMIDWESLHVSDQIGISHPLKNKRRQNFMSAARALKAPE